MTMTSRPSQMLLRLRPADSASGVSRETISRLAAELDLSETQVVHLALRRLARELLPQYEADDGPLTAVQRRAIAKAVPQGKAKSVRSSIV
jgi:hypothetical protein